MDHFYDTIMVLLCPLKFERTSSNLFCEKKNLQNLSFCAPWKKVSHKGLRRHVGEKIMTEFVLLKYSISQPQFLPVSQRISLLGNCGFHLQNQ